MDMNDIIEKKRDGGKLTEEEIEDTIHAVKKIHDWYLKQ